MGIGGAGAFSHEDTLHPDCIESAVTLKSLKGLCLSGIDLESIKPEVLESLNQLDSLKVLQIYSNSLSEELVPSIAKLNRIEELHLKIWSIKSRDIAPLAEMKALVSLMLMGSPEYRDLIELTQQLPNLKHLVIDGPITFSEEVRTLISASGLESIRIQVKSMSKSDLEKLKSDFPDCGIRVFNSKTREWMS